MLRYPFFKALLSHITTDAMFQSIFPNFTIVIFCYLLFAVVLYVPVGYESGKYVALGGNNYTLIVIKVNRFYSLSVWYTTRVFKTVIYLIVIRFEKVCTRTK